MYRRGKTHDGSFYCEHKKHDRSLPPVDANTFLPKQHARIDRGSQDAQLGQINQASRRRRETRLHR